MRRVIVRVTVLIVVAALLSSCALSTRLSTITVQDATDAVSNAQLADDPAAVQCFASKLENERKGRNVESVGRAVEGRGTAGAQEVERRSAEGLRRSDR